MVQYPAIGGMDGARGPRARRHQRDSACQNRYSACQNRYSACQNVRESQSWRHVMGLTRWLLVLALAPCAAWPSATQAESVWDAMRAPGAVVVLRHSYAPGGFDPPDAKLEDCS